ncbi:hypothetical protein [Amycolatopsis sp. NPDC003731]
MDDEGIHDAGEGYAGSPLGHSAAPPGEGFSFAIGQSSGVKSTVHKIFSSKSKSDVYLVTIPTGGVMKVSFHESGVCQHSYLSNVAMQYFERNSDRHVDKWSLLKPFAAGWCRAYYITIPRTELREYELSELGSAPVRWIEDPGRGYWVNVHIIFRDPGSQIYLSVDDAVRVGELRLNNGGAVAVFANRFKPTPEQAKIVAKYRDMFLANEELRSQIGESENPVAGLYGYDKEGVRGVTELSMTAPPVGFTEICTGQYDPLVAPGIRFHRRRNNSSA